MGLYFMAMDYDSARAVRQAARRSARATEAPLLLAISGGLDSMVLLHAMAAVARSRIAAVATMDHATGKAATTAASHVARVAASLGLPVVMQRLGSEDRPTTDREAAWRRQRYQFLRAEAASLGARVVTAHTEDDHLETVLMRLLRGSGARGLAGLHAPSDIVRPFLGLRRAVLASYAAAAGVAWVEDPSNHSPRFFRNRVRHDLLPALRRADPAIDAALLAASREAADWRSALETVVDDRLRVRRAAPNALIVASAELAGYDRDSLAMLWGSLAGRVGLSLDRRGTQRLAAFTSSVPESGTVPLSGGWCVDARPGSYLLCRRPPERAVPTLLPEQGAVEWGQFRFRVATDRPPPARAARRGGEWHASFPVGEPSIVRSWVAGDRLATAGAQPRRRVKRYLSEAGVRGVDRAGWPVVVAGDDVVWIPGVRRSDAATARSGRPERHYICERIDR
ncbi:MAG: tRNA lysidine(34) synthetase TilS [Gemmatimonadota bacterium]|nr:tRNA lysidine(34) synthetase TilS [Gemmatimonadota bacterium]